MAERGSLWRRGGTAALAVAIVAVLGLGTSSLAIATSGHHPPTTQERDGIRVRVFHDAMRRLWVDHVTWTRLFIVSFAAELPDLDATTARLLQNQEDIGDAVKPFYGRAAGNELTDLLTEHILTAADLLDAAKSGDTAAFDEARRLWYDNARRIARFLHEANPRNWPLRDMRSMMRMHLDLTLEEASHQLGGDYAASVASFDAIETQILHMADMLSSGIVAQFPDAFA
jgi:hypothetical protein